MIRKLKYNIISQSLRDIHSILEKKEKINFILLCLLSFGGSFLDVLGLATIIPIIMAALEPASIFESRILSALYEFGGFSNERNFMIALAVCLLIIFLLKNSILFLINYVQSSFARNIATNLSRKTFNKYYILGYPFFKKHHSSKLITNISVIPRQFSSGLLLPLITFISEGFILILIVIAILIADYTLFFTLIFILGPGFLLFYNLTKKKIYNIGRERKMLQPVNFSYVSQAIRGFVDVKLFNKEKFFLDRFINKQDQLNKGYMMNYIINFIPPKITEIFAALGILIIFVYSLTFAGGSRELLIFLTIFATAAYRMMPSMNRMLTSLVTIRINEYTLEILKEIRDFKSEMKEQYKSLPSSLPFSDKIKLKHIHFKFPDSEDPFLKDISFEIKKGEAVGFIGRSGAGKTTLINIILQFLKHDKGELLVDERPITEELLPAWHKLCAYVKQDVFIIDGTLKENIAFGESGKDINNNKVEQAIRDASLEEFIASLPEGNETTLKEMGSNLSGGQKQRIEIARALYKNAEILIFDEATSALDYQTEKEVLESVNYLKKQKNKTILIIAHRLSTLKTCDKIFKLEQGKLRKI